MIKRISPLPEDTPDTVEKPGFSLVPSQTPLRDMGGHHRPTCYGPLPERDRGYTLSLLSTCRQIFNEASEILYSTNEFALPSSSSHRVVLSRLHLCPLSLFLDLRQATHLSCLRRLRIVDRVPNIYGRTLSCLDSRLVPSLSSISLHVSLPLDQSGNAKLAKQILQHRLDEIKWHVEHGGLQVMKIPATIEVEEAPFNVLREIDLRFPPELERLRGEILKTVKEMRSWRRRKVEGPRARVVGCDEVRREIAAPTEIVEVPPEDEGWPNTPFVGRTMRAERERPVRARASRRLWEKRRRYGGF
jgi:hypothetical protein